MNKICTKSTKAQEVHKRCSVDFFVNFRGVGIKNPVKHLRWSLFCNLRNKANIFNWVLNTPLKL